jgi:hypothetical protein
LTDTIRLETDDYNYKLIETVVITDGGKGKKAKAENVGTERDNVLGYYSTLKNALTGFMNLEIKRCDAKTIQEVLDHIKATEKVIDKVLGVK